jgi:dTDP-4-dehydrorhamnose 3,5-epimerase
MTTATPWLRFEAAPLAGLLIAQRQRRDDARGSFGRMFCADEFREAGLDPTIAQINHSLTRRKGAVRGLHYQHPPHAESKLVSCLRGEVFDVAVDLRCGSPTFLQWHAELLSESNGRSLFIPRGFAHGFQTLRDDCELLYLHSTPYAAASEGGVSPTDALLRIRWPLAFTDISDRDASHVALTADFNGIVETSS